MAFLGEYPEEFRINGGDIEEDTRNISDHHRYLTAKSGLAVATNPEIRKNEA